MKAPPLGLIPERYYELIANDDRIADIEAAINRYHTADKPVPSEWLDELVRREEFRRTRSHALTR